MRMENGGRKNQSVQTVLVENWMMVVCKKNSSTVLKFGWYVSDVYKNNKKLFSLVFYLVVTRTEDMAGCSVHQVTRV